MRILSHPKKARIAKRNHNVGGTAPPLISIAPAAELEEAFVVMVSDVATTFNPGVTLAGEKDAVQPLGNPEQIKDTEESNEPYWGVT